MSRPRQAIPVRRRRRRGESGQGFWEWAALWALTLGTATVVTAVGAGWAAATYDQHHSNQPLSSGAPPVSHPSVSFTDFSPVGLYEDCIIGVARGLGLTWDGGGLGWTSAANPRPRGADGLDDSKVQAWRNAMSAELGAASETPAWKQCSLPQLPPPLPQSPAPPKTVQVDGSYTIDPSSVQAIGGCGSSTGPTSMTVSGTGTTVNIAGKTLRGTYDASSNAIDVSATDTNGFSQLTLRGTFSSNAGATRFNGSYDITDNTAGCGYQFSALKS
jgi:hypothetical protein